jgi:hypothetical protein
MGPSVLRGALRTEGEEKAKNEEVTHSVMLLFCS